MFPATVRPDGEQTDRATLRLHRRQRFSGGFSVSPDQSQLLLTRHHSLGSLDRYFRTSYAVATLILTPVWSAGSRAALTASSPASARTSENVIEAGSGSKGVSTRFVTSRETRHPCERDFNRREGRLERRERCVTTEDWERGTLHEHLSLRKTARSRSLSLPPKWNPCRTDSSGRLLRIGCRASSDRCATAACSAGSVVAVAGIVLVPPGLNVEPAWYDRLYAEDMARTSRRPVSSKGRKKRTVVVRSTAVAGTVAKTCRDHRALGGNGVAPVLGTFAGCTRLCCLSSAGVSLSSLRRNAREMDNRVLHGIVRARPRRKQLYVRGPRGASWAFSLSNHEQKIFEILRWLARGLTIVTLSYPVLNSSSLSQVWYLCPVFVWIRTCAEGATGAVGSGVSGCRRG